MTFFEELQNAQLPVLTASDSPRIATFYRSLTDDEAELYHDLRDTSRITKRNEAIQFSQQLKDEYTATLTVLTTHENFIAPTNTQVVTAIKFQAKVLKLIIKLLARLLIHI